MRHDASSGHRLAGSHGASAGEVLGLQDFCRVRTSSERKNLCFSVRRAEGDEQKLVVLDQLIASEPGTALVYCSTVKAAKMVHEHLVAQDHAAGLYHGELHAAVRDATQDAFMDGRYRIIVATKAFGMGIDKPDTRMVVHYQLPESLESYLQEAGRAGRDGEPARCVLLFDEKDAAVQYFFSRRKQPPQRAIFASDVETPFRTAVGSSTSSEDAVRDAATMLSKSMSLRDVGTVLGVSRQRAHQLVGDPLRKSPRAAGRGSRGA